MLPYTYKEWDDSDGDYVEVECNDKNCNFDEYWKPNRRDPPCIAESYFKRKGCSSWDLEKTKEYNATASRQIPEECRCGLPELRREIFSSENYYTTTPGTRVYPDVSERTCRYMACQNYHKVELTAPQLDIQGPNPIDDLVDFWKRIKRILLLNPNQPELQNGYSNPEWNEIQFAIDCNFDDDLGCICEALSFQLKQGYLMVSFGETVNVEGLDVPEIEAIKVYLKNDIRVAHNHYPSGPPRGK